MGVEIPTVRVADILETLREYDQSYRSMGSLPELGKLTGARKATRALDADRGGLPTCRGKFSIFS